MNKEECKHVTWDIKAGMLADLYTCRKCGTEKRSWQMKKEKKTITITSEEYKSLLKDKEWLSALEAAGVDSWDGLDHALELFDEWNK